MPGLGSAASGSSCPKVSNPPVSSCGLADVLLAQTTMGCGLGKTPENSGAVDRPANELLRHLYPPKSPMHVGEDTHRPIDGAPEERELLS